MSLVVHFGSSPNYYKHDKGMEYAVCLMHEQSENINKDKVCFAW